MGHECVFLFLGKPVYWDTGEGGDDGRAWSCLAPTCVNESCFLIAWHSSWPDPVTWLIGVLSVVK